MENVTTAIILETRTPKQDKTFPVKLRVTYKREQKYYALGVSLIQKDFDYAMYKFNSEEKAGKKVVTKKKKEQLKEERLYLNSVEQKAISIIKSLPHFTFDLFERHFLTAGKNIDSVYTAYANYIKQLKAEGKEGTASVYLCSYNSVRIVSGKKNLRFSEIDQHFLKEYERKMKEEGNSLSTISMYLRCLRTLFNKAIDAGIVRREIYPFGKNRYKVPVSVNIKKALPLADIERLFLYEAPAGTNEKWALDIWKFSYLCNGINIRDVARLKWKNIDRDRITFIRTKTEHTSKNLKPIVAVIRPEARDIINEWSLDEIGADNYVFRILKPGLTAEQELKRVKQVTKIINKYLKRIANRLGIEKTVTSYSARHSFSTVLKRSGAPIEFISESLGHSDLRTTENYLDSFEDETKREWSDVLTKFSKEKLN